MKLPLLKSDDFPGRAGALPRAEENDGENTPGLVGGRALDGYGARGVNSAYFLRNSA